MAGPAELAAVEARLRVILERYRGRLEAGSLYGLETLRLPGAGTHDFFAGVRVGARYVSFYLKPVYTWPQLLHGVSPALRKRMQGKSCFNFATIDEGLLAELEALVERSFTAYLSRGDSID